MLPLFVIGVLGLGGYLLSRKTSVASAASGKRTCKKVYQWQVLGAPSRSYAKESGDPSKRKIASFVGTRSEALSQVEKMRAERKGQFRLSLQTKGKRFKGDKYVLDGKWSPRCK